MRAVDKRKWDDVRKHYRRLKDPTAKRVMKWQQAVNDPEVSFTVLSDVIHNQSYWPRMTAIRSKAETKLFDRPLSADETIEWFKGEDPVSGEGRAALAQAHYKLGNSELGDQWLRLAWRESRLTRDRQRRIFSRYKSKLTEADHAARADHLIWLGRSYHGSASGLLSLMNYPMN